MPPISRSRAGLGSAVLTLLAALLLCGPALASGDLESGKRVRRVPPELVGSWCPTGGCETRSGGLWNTAGFAAAISVSLLLARRRPQPFEMITQRK